MTEGSRTQGLLLHVRKNNDCSAEKKKRGAEIRRQTQRNPELSCIFASMRDAIGNGGNEGCVTRSQKTAAFATEAQIITAASIQPYFHAQVSSLVSVYECNAAF